MLDVYEKADGYELYNQKDLSSSPSSSTSYLFNFG